MLAGLHTTTILSGRSPVASRHFFGSVMPDNLPGTTTCCCYPAYESCDNPLSPASSSKASTECCSIKGSIFIRGLPFNRAWVPVDFLSDDNHCILRLVWTRCSMTPRRRCCAGRRAEATAAFAAAEEDEEEEEVVIVVLDERAR